MVSIWGFRLRSLFRWVFLFIFSTAMVVVFSPVITPRTANRRITVFTFSLVPLFLRKRVSMLFKAVSTPELGVPRVWPVLTAYRRLRVVAYSSWDLLSFHRLVHEPILPIRIVVGVLNFSAASRLIMILGILGCPKLNGQKLFTQIARLDFDASRSGFPVRALLHVALISFSLNCFLIHSV
jgi:hypothetical protein